MNKREEKQAADQHPFSFLLPSFPLSQLVPSFVFIFVNLSRIMTHLDAPGWPCSSVSSFLYEIFNCSCFGSLRLSFFFSISTFSFRRSSSVCLALFYFVLAVLFSLNVRFFLMVVLGLRSEFFSSLCFFFLCLVDLSFVRLFSSVQSVQFLSVICLQGFY